MLKTVAIAILRVRRLINQITIIGTIVAIGFLLSSCVVPTLTGPYYQPTYPQKSQNVWIHSDWTERNKVLEMRAGPEIPQNVYLKDIAGEGRCQMSFTAIAQNERFVLSWEQIEHPLKGVGKTCQIHVHDGPVVLENLDDGSRLTINIFERTFVYGPGLDIHKRVDLVSLIPGFAAVPAPKRRYVLSIELERKFNGSLPDEARIQLPDIVLGKRQIQLPPLILKRYVRSGKGWWYVPVSEKEVQPTKPAGKSLGGGSLVYKPADIWYEENSVVRLRSSFRGDPFTWNRDFTKRNDDESGIDGEIFIEILGDEPVRLTSDQIAFRVPGDKEPKFVSVKRSKWILKRFTTVNLSERLDYLPDYSGPEKTYDDWSRVFLAVIPDYRPGRFKVTLPRVKVNGHVWPIQPIEFEYKSPGRGSMNK